MGKHKTDRTKQQLIRAMDYNAYRLADQHITQAIVKEEHRQDVMFDGLVRTGIIVKGIEEAVAQRAGRPDVDELLRKRYGCE